MKSPLIKLRKAVANFIYRQPQVSFVITDAIAYALMEDQFPESRLTSKSDVQQFLTVYAVLSPAFTAVNTIAMSAAQVPFRLYLAGQKRDHYITKHPFLSNLRNPNYLDTRFKLWWKTFSFLELTGNAYWFLTFRGEESDNRSVEKIYPVRPDRVEVIPKGKTDVEYRIKDEAEVWSSEEVVHFSQFNPLSDYTGLSSIAPLASTVLIDAYLTKYDKTFFENAERPKQVLTMPEGVFLDEKTEERLKRELQEAHQSVEMFHKTLVLPSGMTLEELRNPTHADTDYLKHKEQIRKEIFSGLGCYHLIALEQGANRATLDSAYRMFYEMTLLPKLINAQETVTKELLPFYQDDALDIEAEFDVRKLRGLREAALAESISDFRYAQLGIKTVNEIRRERAIGDPVEWGDEPPAPSPFSYTRFQSNEERKREQEVKKLLQDDETLANDLLLQSLLEDRIDQ